MIIMSYTRWQDVNLQMQISLLVVAVWVELGAGANLETWKEGWVHCGYKMNDTFPGCLHLQFVNFEGRAWRALLIILLNTIRN